MKRVGFATLAFASVVDADSCSDCVAFVERAPRHGKMAIIECNKMCHLGSECANLCAIIQGGDTPSAACVEAKLCSGDTKKDMTDFKEDNTTPMECPAPSVVAADGDTDCGDHGKPMHPDGCPTFSSNPRAQCCSTGYGYRCYPPYASRRRGDTKKDMTDFKEDSTTSMECPAPSVVALHGDTGCAPGAHDMCPTFSSNPDAHCCSTGHGYRCYPPYASRRRGYTKKDTTDSKEDSTTPMECPAPSIVAADGDTDCGDHGKPMQPDGCPTFSSNPSAKCCSTGHGYRCYPPYASRRRGDSKKDIAGDSNETIVV